MTALAHVREPLERRYTEAEVAQKYRVSPRTVREWRALRKIRFIKIGRIVRYRQEDLDAFERNHAEGRRLS